LLIFFLSLASFVLFLIYERISLERSLRSIPLRIAVTGTRGKSSVARILASILTEDGRRVLCKTTGSQAMILLPDGGQIELLRRGTPSILEQVQTVKRASRLRADCLVAEVMSIHPENHRVETHQILRAHVTAITNARLDHTEAMGASREEVASVLGSDIAPLSTVFVPEQSACAPLVSAAAGSGSLLVKVSRGTSASVIQAAPDLAKSEFPENLDLVCSVARHLKIDPGTVLNGILKARHDIGKLRVWTVRSADSTRSYYLVNAFAANDPESTLRILAKVLDLLPACSGKVIGLLNLRADRVPRTLQWLEVLKGGAITRFNRLYVVGNHHRAVRKSLPQAEILTKQAPEDLTACVTAGIEDGAMIFGFGNIKGAGLLLAAYWGRIGADYGRPRDEDSRGRSHS
jgi:poly-gamma-glutamate synthase PgsB/CapB